nr:MAG TPA: hypothetical protein [Caudoviricetes sp.]
MHFSIIRGILYFYNHAKNMNFAFVTTYFR